MSTPPDLLTSHGSTPTGVFADAAGSPTLTWSADLPAADGWWWWRRKPTARTEPVEIWTIMSGGQAFSRQCTHSSGILTLENMSAAYPEQRWAGPLLEPHEPTPVEPSGNKKLTD